MNKLISIIMGVYNCGDTLGEALESIVRQTYSNWEIVMCDDGSSDDTIKVAEKYAKKYGEKVKILKNDKNMGLNYTLNKCLKHARGEYIARMDGDDICAPVRLEKEIEILEKNEDISIVSTDMELFDEGGVWGRTYSKERPEKIDLVKKTPFCHAPCMVRKTAFDAVDGYSVEERLLRVEDYHLWVKMYQQGFRGINIQEPLYSMRDDRSAQNRRKFKYRLNEAYVKKCAIVQLGLPIYCYIYCLRPILVGLMPKKMYKWAHRARKIKGE